MEDRLTEEVWIDIIDSTVRPKLGGFLYYTIKFYYTIIIPVIVFQLRSFYYGNKGNSGSR